MPQYKPALIVSFALFLMTVTPVRATDPTPTPIPQEGVKFTNVGAVGKLSDENEKKEVGIFERFNKKLNEWVTEIIPHGSWNYQVEETKDFRMSKLETLERMLKNAQSPLSPLTIQQRSIPTRDKLRVTGTVHQCLYKREAGGHLVLVHDLYGKYLSDIIPELSRYLTFTRQLSPMIGDTASYKPDENGNYNFDKYPPLELTNYPDCSSTKDGTEMDAILTGVKFTGFLGQIFNVLAEWLGRPDRHEVTAREQTSHKQNNPYAELEARVVLGEKEAMVDYLDSDEKEEIEKNARGYVPTFFPKMLRDKLQDFTLEKPPRGEQQNFSVKVTGDANRNYELYTHDNYYYQMETAGEANECLIYPKSKQGGLPYKCPQPTQTAALGDVCGVAKAYNIPCCQLKGVMELETGSGANMGSGSCSTKQGNFRCCRGEACGPAQILCGQYDAFAGNDKLDMCSQVGAAELLSRAMLLKLCQADGKCDSYDWTRWGEFVKKNYKVPDGDYTATAYFYGLANGCTVSACSQYRWGAGRGYCDAVENYCKTGQILPDNTSSEFCAECNEELIRAGQTPIQCTQ